MACVASTRSRGLAVKSAQSMTVSRHVQSVRSVHRRRNPPQERLRNWQVRQHDTRDSRSEQCTALASSPFLVSTRSLILPRDASSSPTPPRPSTFSREREKERISIQLSVHPQRRISLCISSRRARLAAFRMKLYIWRPSFRRWAKNGAVRSPSTFFLDATIRVSVDSFLPSFFILFFFFEKFLWI